MTTTAQFLDPFVLRALAAGLGVAVVAGVVGCFVVWRRMAYFGDSLAHSALLGVALGFAAGISINLGVLIVCAVFAILLLWLQHKQLLATDTLLGIMAHAALSIGLVTISLLGQRINIHAYLFGDILTVTTNELWWIYGGGIVVLGALAYNWPALIMMTVNEDLAKAENIRTFLAHLLLMLLMTIVVAVSLRVVGILLITSMLIIPAATARQLARSPEAMAALSAAFGATAVIAGLAASMHWDIPTAPAIVVAAATLFAIMVLTPLIKR
ncbi:MAG: metal ABC transporter permease [Proteobacteria bacterium]|nr:metal ABC transporter permease [Pseudomonadota bacterium]